MFQLIEVPAVARPLSLLNEVAPTPIADSTNPAASHLNDMRFMLAFSIISVQPVDQTARHLPSTKVCGPLLIDKQLGTPCAIVLI